MSWARRYRIWHNARYDRYVERDGESLAIRFKPLYVVLRRPPHLRWGGVLVYETRYGYRFRDAVRAEFWWRVEHLLWWRYRGGDGGVFGWINRQGYGRRKRAEQRAASRPRVGWGYALGRSDKSPNVGRRVGADADPLELARAFYPTAIEAEWADETCRVLNVRLDYQPTDVVIDLVVVPLPEAGSR